MFGENKSSLLVKDVIFDSTHLSYGFYLLVIRDMNFFINSRQSLYSNGGLLSDVALHQSNSFILR